MKKNRQLIKTTLIAIFALLLLQDSYAQTMMALPNHSSTYSSAIRGYWFTAPIDFTIVGLRVPSQAGSGLQRIQVIKINDNTPVLYSSTSTNFTSLALIYNATNGVIQNVNIPITAGDKIAILGTAGTTNSYGNPTSVTSQISGHTVTLKRTGYQGNMGSSGIPNYWTQTSGSISRVEMYYETCSTAITKDPVPSITVCENQDAQLSANAIDVASYQWQVDEGNGFMDIANGTHYADATTNELTIVSAPFNFDGYAYRCLAQKSSCIDTSKSSVLHVNGLVKLDALGPDTTCVHAAKDLEVKGTGSIVSYKWQVFVNGTGYIDVPNQFPYAFAGNKLMITNVQDTMDGSKYRCIVTGVCDISTSSDLTLTVNSIPTVAIPPADYQAMHGESVLFKVQATGKNATYQWQVATSTKPVFVNINEGGIYSGVKTNILRVKGVSRVQDNFKFRCIIGTASGCETAGDTSEFAVLNVEPPVSVSTISNDETMILYPNPTGNTVYIKMNNKTADGMLYRVLDKTGRTLMTGDINSGNKTRLDVTKLPTGIYMVQISDDMGKPITQSRFTKL